MQELPPRSLAGRAEAPGGSYLALAQPGSPRALRRLFLPHQVFPITAS